MGIFRRKREVRADPTPEDMIDCTLRAQLLGAEKEITREKAMMIPSVSGSIRLLAGIVSSIPIRLYRLDEKGKPYEVRDDPRTKFLNDETGDTLTAPQFWRAIVEDYFLGKGGYAFIEKKLNTVTGLFYVKESSVSFYRGTDPIYKFYRILADGREYYPFEFLRFLRNSKDGACGSSVLTENNLILSTAYNSLVYENAVVKAGGSKRGFLESDRQLSPDAVDALKTGWKELYSNTKNNALVLNNGVKFHESSASSVEMQLNENKRQNSVEISMLFGVPNSILAGTATAEDFSRLIKIGIMPLLNDFEASLDRDLLLESEKKDHYFAFDAKEITRGSIKERYEAYQIGINAHILQPDEARKSEDLDPLGLDALVFGLDTVLYNPKTKEIYTPNTNQHNTAV